MSRWLAQPHVARWWGDTSAELDKTASHIGERGIQSYLVALDGSPFGYVQCYDPSQDPVGAMPEQPVGTRGIDFFIGHPHMLQQGHGTAFLTQFTDALLERSDVTRAIADPDPANRASIRALLRAGFRDTGSVSLPWGTMCLVVKGRLGSDRAGDAL